MLLMRRRTDKLRIGPATTRRQHTCGVGYQRAVELPAAGHQVDGFLSVPCLVLFVLSDGTSAVLGFHSSRGALPNRAGRLRRDRCQLSEGVPLERVLVWCVGMSGLMALGALFLLTWSGGRGGSLEAGVADGMGTTNHDHYGNCKSSGRLLCSIWDKKNLLLCVL